MSFFEALATHSFYWLVFIIMAIGLYILIAYDNLIKKLVGLSLFQSSIFIFFILVGKISGGAAPILTESTQTYSNPLPHVMILTAIVVAIATSALGLSMVLRIHDTWNTLDEQDLSS